MERLCQLLIFVALLVAAPVSAEVMDKEMSVPQIWQALAWGLLVAFIAAAIWRWLLVISFSWVLQQRSGLRELSGSILP